MKIIIIAVTAVLALTAQPPPHFNRPGRVQQVANVVQAAPQSAQVLSIPISADQATVLETARTNPPYLDASGNPMYPDLSSFVANYPAVKSMVLQLAQSYPTAAVLAKQRAAADAQAAADRAAADATAAAAAVSVPVVP